MINRENKTDSTISEKKPEVIYGKYDPLEPTTYDRASQHQKKESDTEISPYHRKSPPIQRESSSIVFIKQVVFLHLKLILPELEELISKSVSNPSDFLFHLSFFSDKIMSATEIVVNDVYDLDSFDEFLGFITLVRNILKNNLELIDVNSIKIIHKGLSGFQSDLNTSNLIAAKKYLFKSGLTGYSSN